MVAHPLKEKPQKNQMKTLVADLSDCLFHFLNFLKNDADHPLVIALSKKHVIHGSSGNSRSLCNFLNA